MGFMTQSMKMVVRSSLVVFASALIWGCSEETSGGGAGGATTSSGTGGATTSSGTGGATTSSGTGGAGGEAPICHGDEAAWAAIPKGGIACTTNSDCCVVANSCLAEAYVVHADYFDAAQQAWPWCEDMGCANCEPPNIDIACVNDVCVGSLDPNNLDPGTSHCGVDPEPLPSGGLEGTFHFNCSGPG